MGLPDDAAELGNQGGTVTHGLFPLSVVARERRTAPGMLRRPIDEGPHARAATGACPRLRAMTKMTAAAQITAAAHHRTLPVSSAKPISPPWMQ